MNTLDSIRGITYEIRKSLHHHDILKTASRILQDCFQATRCGVVCVHTGTEKTIKGYVEYPENRTDWSSFSAKRLFQETLVSDKAVQYTKGFYNPELIYELFHDDINSIMMARTSCAAGVNGIIIVQSSYPRQWTSDELILLEVLAEQVGVALIHAELLEQQVLQTKALLSQNEELQHAKDIIEQARLCDLEVSERKYRYVNRFGSYCVHLADTQ